MILAIYGAGGLGQEVCDMVDRHFSDRFEEVIFINDLISSEEMISGHAVMPYGRFKERHVPGQAVFAIATGEPYYRQQFYERIKADGYDLTELIHPDAEISPSVKMGEGVIIGKGSVINHHAELGNNICMMVYCVIGHDTRIADHCQLSSFVTTGGHCSVGACTFAGQNAVIREHTQIGSFAVIGESANVIRDVADEEVLAGNPARVLRHNAEKRVFRQ